MCRPLLLPDHPSLFRRDATSVAIASRFAEDPEFAKVAWDVPIRFCKGLLEFFAFFRRIRTSLFQMIV